MNPDYLNTIVPSVRVAFLSEDAPGYLETLRAASCQGYQQADYLSILSALHSLKGGAGVAQFYDLNRLAHSLENLVQFLPNQSVSEQELLWNLFKRAVEEIENVFSQANSKTLLISQDLVVDPELLQTLESFQQAYFGKGVDNLGFGLARTIRTGSQLVKHIGKTVCQAASRICKTIYLTKRKSQSLKADENEGREQGRQGDQGEAREIEPRDFADIVNKPLNRLRSWRSRYLERKGRLRLSFPFPSVNTDYSTLGKISQYTAADSLLGNAPLPEMGVSRDLSKALGETVTTPKLGKILRLPLERLDHMVGMAEDLIIYNERQTLQQQQLEQANIRLQDLAPQFQQIQSELRAVYENLISGSPTSTKLNAFATFDESLHTLQELISLFQSARADIDLANRNLIENQKETRLNLSKLYTTLIRSRLVPFKKLAKLFLPYIGRLNQRYGKEIKLVVRGEELLVEQSIFEELRPCFNHLINNAFDHGIESTEERIALKKPQRAQILLQATTRENELIFSVSDDGRGIDLQKIYRHALQRGIVSAQTPMGELSQSEILSFLFQPGFSTASSTNELSGRGMGLDIVRDLVRSLGGTLQIETVVGQGTTFIIKLPPSLTLMPLLLCRIQKRIVAIPATSVLEILSYSELELISVNPPLAQWKQSNIPVIHLWNLLQYSDIIADIYEFQTEAKAVVLNGSDAPLIAIVDTVIRQQKLIVKPLDKAVKSPPYLAGCTILATGEVVPVLLPQKFGCLQQVLNSSSTPKNTNPQNQHQKKPAILLAEDSQATRILIEGLLKSEGFKVISCDDGQSALSEFVRHSEQIDLVISDIEMPCIDGFTFLKQIRQVRPHSALPVIILSDRSAENYLSQAMDLGANAFVNKQALSEILILTINKLLSVAPSTYN